MQVESGDGQVFVFHKAEGLKGEVSFLGYPIPINLCLGITITPNNNNRCDSHKRIKVCSQLLSFSLLFMNDSPNKKIIRGAAGWKWVCCGIATVQQHIEPYNTQ